MHLKVLTLVLTLLGFNLTLADDELNTFCIRDNILFGVGSASYQIEGAWNYGDKSENIWDDLTHNYPDLVSGGATGDVAADAFNKIEEDVANLQEIGAESYQFSISWSRLLPEGYSNNVSEIGLQYYNNLIDALVAADIAPMVVLYHWDLPTVLQKLGGWASTELIDLYADYAQVAFENFGDRVKYWITFSSPSEVCKAYGSDYRAPAEVYFQTGIGEYMCTYTILKAHAKAYHLYNDTYRSSQNGKIGIALLANWYEPDTVSSADTIAAIRALHFEIGLFAHPIFTSTGDFPELVKDTIRRRSVYEGFPYSRLPELTSEEISYIWNSADFFGINHYTTYIVADRRLYTTTPEYFLDMELTYWQPALSWEDTAVDSIKVVPWGFRKLLIWLSKEYPFGVTFYVTQNGYPDYGGDDDDSRISFIQRYISALVDAEIQGASVQGYTYWNFLDGFEWLEGYNISYGMVSVNMSDPNRSRTLKSSAGFYKDLIKYRTLALNSSCTFTTTPEETTSSSYVTDETPSVTGETTISSDLTTESPTANSRGSSVCRFATPYNLSAMMTLSIAILQLFSKIRI